MHMTVQKKKSQLIAWEKEKDIHKVNDAEEYMLELWWLGPLQSSWKCVN